MQYFTPEEEIVDPKVVFFSPKEGESGGLCCNRIKEWKTYHHYEYMCTNVLVLLSRNIFAYGNAMQKKGKMQPLADYMGKPRRR